MAKTLSNDVDQNVQHPIYYGGADDPYEAIKVIEDWNLGFHLGNTVKYICRAGLKAGNSALQDLEKAAWYLNRKIERIKQDQKAEEITVSTYDVNYAISDDKVKAATLKKQEK